MADIVHKGVESRVYVRFRGNPGAVDPAEHAALRKFQRAGARLDRDCGLWYVAKHQREAAVAVVLETGGSVDPDPDDIPSEVWVKAPDGGELMRSWWVLTAAGPSGFWFLNPFLPDPGSAVVMTWEEARAEYQKATRPDVKAALAEIGKAAKRLAGIDRKPDPPNPVPDPKRPDWVEPRATEKQLNALNYTLHKLSKLDPGAHATLEAKFDSMGNERITKRDASKLLDEIGAAVEESLT